MEQSHLHDFTAHITDFADTAAFGVCLGHSLPPDSSAHDSVLHEIKMNFLCIPPELKDRICVTQPQAGTIPG